MSKLESSLADLVITKENVEKKLLQKFEFLNDPKQLHNLYLSYDYDEKDENMVKIWDEILKYLFLGIFSTFGMKISEIKSYTIIKNKIPTGLNNIIQELRIRQKLITDFDISNQAYYNKYYPEIYPENSKQGWGSYLFSGVKNLVNFGSVKIGCSEEKNDEEVKRRDDITEEQKYQNFPDNTIIFNYEMLKKNCDGLLSFLSEILQESDNEIISKKEFIKEVNNTSSNGGIYNGINLPFGSIYIEHCLIFLQKLKKIAIFTVEQNSSKVEFIKLLISPNNSPNEKDILTAQIMIKCESLQYRINDLDKKIVLCLNNVKNLIQKGNKNGAKPWLIRKKNYEKYKQNCENIHLTLIQQIIDIKNAEGEKNLTEILKATNQVYKNIGMDNDKFIEVSEDLKDLNMAKEEMYEGINNLVNEGDDADIENELKQLEAENENENLEFPNAPEVPVNPFSEEQQQLYQQK
jgi:hypothetical protein